MATSIRPVTSVGIAMGRSTTVESSGAAGEPVADQDVGEQGAHHGVDDGREGGGDQGEADRGERRPGPDMRVREGAEPAAESLRR